MKSLTTQLALSLTLVLGSLSNAFAANIDYPQTGPIFVQDAILVQGDVDTFFFTNAIAGSYHFFSYGFGDGITSFDTDTWGYIYSDTYASTLASNDDSGPSLGFCVEAYLLAGENITIYVEGYSSLSDGDYTVYGLPGTCADSGFFYTNDGGTAPVPAPASSDSGSFSLPAILFTILGLGAVRLRRIFA